MNFIERWVVRRITWMRPLEDLSLDELFKLQRDLGMEIAKRMEVQGWERKMKEEGRPIEELMRK
jgi:hypothetical protein